MNLFPLSVAAAVALPEPLSLLQNLSFPLAKSLLPPPNLPPLFSQLFPGLPRGVTLLGAAL